MKRIFDHRLKIILTSIIIFLGYSCTHTEPQENWIKLPYDRLLQPAGKLIEMGDTAKENHALDCALSPDEHWLAVQGRYSIDIISTSRNEVIFSMEYDRLPEIKGSMATFSGICWHGKEHEEYIFFSIVMKNALSYIVQMKWEGTKAKLINLFEYDSISSGRPALPNGILVRKEGGHDYLYVVLNGKDEIIKQEIKTGGVLWESNTGVAPYGLAMARNKLYVTNWAGRVPEDSDKNVAGVPWGSARIDPKTAACWEGSISIFDPADGKLLKEIVVGLHPNSIIAARDEDHVFITNSNSDQVTVINTKYDTISEVISVRLQGKFNNYFGDSPNGLAITSNGKTLYVANGMDNALAVISLGKNSANRGKGKHSKIKGFIPTAAYPSSVSILEGKSLYVTNIESLGANRPFDLLSYHSPVYNAHHMLASVSVIDIPDGEQLAAYTDTVISANQLERLKSAELPPREGVSPLPVPERIGEPSVFKHVLYIIKENRTYDQVLGDDPRGNGDSSLCIFGKQVTPNTHKLVREFTLLDNFYVSGKCSAEGHNWTDASIVTDYIEKDVRAWFRSYPHTLNDAMVYAPTGFIWDNARDHGRSVRIYGEAATPVFDNNLTWSDVYKGFLKNESFAFTNKTTLNTVRELLSENYPGYDGHRIPDILRAETFIRELHRYEELPGDSLPQLMVMALPNDHTAGTRPGFPTPRAMVADNDLALGRIVEAVSHSRFWNNTVIFVVEDDSQDGWDHISAYRSVAIVISAYSRMNETIHLPYNQPSIVRTIEQILGLPPMNIQDAIATPMIACFNVIPDFKPYASVENEIPLDEMNPGLSALKGKRLHYARMSLGKQFDGIDTGNDELFNHILWFAAKGTEPYPEKFAEDKD
jgi:DNA-binding beta-propeller fold protein YncE